jgi:hypothetical protein
MDGYFKYNSVTQEYDIITTSGAANDGGLPVGSIFGIHSNVVPPGYLPCNGAQYDTTQYPALYAILASDHLPDLREAVLVGTGLSERAEIAAHDVYTIGQFKDDQVENMPNGLVTGSSETFTTAAGIVHSEEAGNAPTERAWRTGTTTHGKQYGVNYVIKATTGTIQIADPEIIAMIQEWADLRFSPTDKENLYNNAILVYDKEHDKLIPLAKPSTSNTVLTAQVSPGGTVSRNIYHRGDTYYLGSLQPTIVPAGEFVSSVSVGYTVIYEDKWYTQDGNLDWYEVESMNNGAFVLGAQVTSVLVITALNELTPVEVTYETWAVQEDDGVDYSWEEPVDKVGDLATLTTTDKTDAVSAINEVNAEADTNATHIGDLTTLVTTDKSSIVDALNEVATSSAGNTIGAIIEVANASVIPAGYLLADGRDTTGTADELATYHPELYAYLGNSNVLPSIDTFIPDYSNATTFTSPFTVTSYGWINVGGADAAAAERVTNINGVRIQYFYGYPNGWQGSDYDIAPVKPGDVVTSSATTRQFIPCVKATNRLIRG